MRLLWCWGLAPSDALAELESHGFEIQLFSGGQAELVEAMDGTIDAVLIRRGISIDRNVLDHGKNLKYVQRAGSATANIDLDACREKGVVVAATLMHIDVGVAEHAFSLMLGLAKQLVTGDKEVRDALYLDMGITPWLTTETSFPTNWTGTTPILTVFRKTLGVIGLGEIGSALVRRAKAFDMNVIYHDLHRASAEKESSLAVRYVSLDELASESDFISLHLPHTQASEHLVNAHFLSLMKPTAFLVNCARGGLVDEAALIRALAEGRIAGAGLDVFAFEPLPQDSPLLAAPNTIFSPHRASSTDIDLDVEQLVRNLIAFKNGDQIDGVVVPR